MHVLIKRKLEGPSIPELGQPTSVTFDSVTVPLNRPTTGPAALASYELQRSLNGTTWSTIATGPGIFGNPAAQYVDGGRLALTTYHYRARATDVAGRVSDFCAPVSTTTVASDTPSRYRVLNNEVAYYLQGYAFNNNGIGVNATYRANAAKADVVMISASGSGDLSNETTLINQLRTLRSGCKLLRYTDPRYWYDDATPASGSPFVETYQTINANSAPAIWTAKNAAGQTLAHTWSPSNTNGINWSTVSSATNSLGQSLPQAFRYQWQQNTPWQLYDGVFLDDLNPIPANFCLRGGAGSVDWSYLQDGVNYSWASDYTFGDAHRNGIAGLVNQFRQISPQFLATTNTSDLGYWYLQYRFPFSWSSGGRPPTPFSSTALNNLVDIGFCEISFPNYGLGIPDGSGTYPIRAWFSLANFYLSHELQLQNCRTSLNSRMGAQRVFHHTQVYASNSAVETQLDYSYVRACWAMTKLVEGGAYAISRTTRQPFFLDETCIKLGAAVSTRSMGTLTQPSNNDPAFFTLRAPNATNGSAQFYWAEFENALVVFRGDTTGLTLGSSFFGDGTTVSYTLPSAGAGYKWQRPNCNTYVNPDFADLAMVAQSPSFNNGADATTSTLKPLYGEVFLRVNA